MKHLHAKITGSALCSASTIPFFVDKHDFRKDRLRYAGDRKELIVTDQVTKKNTSIQMAFVSRGPKLTNHLNKR